MQTSITSTHSITPSPSTVQNSHTAFFGDVPLAEVRRAGVTESLHCGAVAITNARGNILYAAGDPRRLTFARSALKPFQAAAFFAADGVSRMGLELNEAAVLCASHSGETRHAEAVARILNKIDAAPNQLRCGCHVPYRFSWFNKLPPTGETWSELHHNCSGKHAGFLAAARLQGASLENYINPLHPVQIASRKGLAACMGLSVDDLVIGTDGCSAPTYATPLHHLAQGFARLALGKNVPDDASHEYSYGLENAFKAMTTHPEMVSGEGRNDLALTLAGEGDWVCKIGAEGIQAIGIRSLGLGIAIKVADGNMRGLYPATIAVLEQLGLMNEARRTALADWAKPQLKNAAGLPVGEIVPAVMLREFN
jgi:L-asparaginase II